MACYSGADRISKVTVEIVSANQICSGGILYAADADDAIDISFLQSLFTGKGIDVSLSIKAGTLAPSGMTLLVENRSTDNILFGQPFELERMDDGIWCDIDVINESYAFTAIGYGLMPKGMMEHNVYWDTLYGELLPGEYRFTKEFSVERSAGGFDDYYFSIAFQIE